MLRVKVKFGSAQIGIEKALAAAAEREGLPREEIDELGVPSYGLTEVGKRVETMGEYGVELVVTGIGETELRFIKKDGKVQKSVPAALKTEFAEELKELKTAAKDIGAMLPAQRDRLDSLFLQNKTWAYATWRERCLDHPLVGVLSRRLIWMFRDSGSEAWRAATYDDASGALIDATGKPVSIDVDVASVRLWHPIEAPGGTDETLAWRRFFEEREIRQPFKQAHREIYLLTDAERRTETYSNRYAAHVIRQHQFSALCGVRGWKNRLRLMVDDEYPPPRRGRSRCGGCAREFWVEGAGDDYGTDTNEAGVYNLLTTDQVRFYAIDAAQVSAHASGGGYGRVRGPGEVMGGMRLEDVPTLVFSEIMRDVDLFVGVCSVANNPQWQDGGPGGEQPGLLVDAELQRPYRERRRAAGAPSSGSSRASRSRPCARCWTSSSSCAASCGRTRSTWAPETSSWSRTTSTCASCQARAGNRAPAGAGASQVFLPFEGDRTLSIILSKAFMLAEDEKIKDPSIVGQIRRGK